MISLIFRYFASRNLKIIMKFYSKQQFTLIFLLFPLFLVAQKAMITGIMKNAPTNDRVELQVHHYYLDGKSDTYRALIDEDDLFTIEADIAEPQFVFLKYHSNYLPIYVEPNDTVFVEADMLRFPMVVRFSAKGGEQNNFLTDFLRQYPINFDEFSKVRYKIGDQWCTMDSNMDARMQAEKVEVFKKAANLKSVAQLAELDAFILNNPGKSSKAFYDFLVAEILYTRAYNLLFYGEIYKNMHDIDPSFFEILYDVPTACQMIGSTAYRHYLMAFMAHRVKHYPSGESVFQQKYLMASDMLKEKSLAFYRSEIIFNGLKDEKYTETLPFYISFLENNQIDIFEEKVADEYERAIRISPGTVAPDFSTVDIDGVERSLSTMRGKVVYLNFWASYCGSCLKKIGEINAFAPEFEAAGVQIVNVSMDKSEDAWRAAVQVQKVLGHNLLSKNIDGNNLGKQYSIEAIPQYFIIGKNGTFETKPHSSKPIDIKNRLLELAKG